MEHSDHSLGAGNMSDAERISKLEQENQLLRADIATLGLYQLQQINLLRSLMTENAMKESVHVGKQQVDAYEELGVIFDKIYDVVQRDGHA